MNILMRRLLQALVESRERELQQHWRGGSGAEVGPGHGKIDIWSWVVANPSTLERPHIERLLVCVHLTICWSPFSPKHKQRIFVLQITPPPLLLFQLNGCTHYRKDNWSQRKEYITLPPIAYDFHVAFLCQQMLKIRSQDICGMCFALSSPCSMRNTPCEIIVIFESRTSTVNDVESVCWIEPLLEFHVWMQVLIYFPSFTLVRYWVY